MTTYLGLCWSFAGITAVTWTVTCMMACFKHWKALSRLPIPSGGGLFGQLSVLSRPDHHSIMTKWASELGGIYRMRLAHMHVRDFRVMSRFPDAGVYILCNVHYRSTLRVQDARAAALRRQ